MMDTIEAKLAEWVGRFTDYESQGSDAAIEAIAGGAHSRRNTNKELHDVDIESEVSEYPRTT